MFSLIKWGFCMLCIWNTFIYQYVLITVFCQGFPGGSAVKNLPAVQEAQELHVQSLGREDPLGEGMATHSSVLAWRTPRTEKPGVLWSIGSQTVTHDWSDLAHTHAYIYIYIYLCIHHLFIFSSTLWTAFSGNANGKEPTVQCRRCENHQFTPWVGKIFWRRARQTTPVFLPGESHEQRNLEDYST